MNKAQTKVFRVNNSQDAIKVTGIRSVSTNANFVTLRGGLRVTFYRNGRVLRTLARSVWGINTELATEWN